ncbi:DNA-binding NtrC family response regulator [Desulfobaculum xiamenense]|uniref:DNA-binding NtrC family response regulator n=1 Tax=Desulfobaculum xiamenense TaxID=995050 RepID=A0A846QKY1_9BACT|nr:DNA-binding NtrC family response regulator [Desulfobaculum xiamenense]
MSTLTTTILIVDDEVAFVDAIARRLDKRGFDIVSAHSGDEALNALAANDKVDVVILDVKMPGMDGIETLKEIRRQFPLVEVIMLTGHGTVESAIEGMKLGAFDFLLKPSDIEELTAKVAEAKSRKAGHEDKILEAQSLDIVLRRGD